MPRRIRLLGLAFALAFMACAPAPSAPSGSAPSGNGGASGVGNPPTTPEMVDGIDLSGKNVQVVYWHNRAQQDQDLLQSMLDEFNQTNPYGIQAHAENAGAAYPDVYNKISAAIQGGQPPEIAVAYPDQAATYRNANAVIDLTPFVNSSKYGLSQEDQQDYFQSFLATDANPQFHGERLGFPTQRSMEVMYYNADWLKQLGYDAPPQDWATWEKVACQASDPSQNKVGFAFRHDASNFASQVFSRGGQMLSEDGSAYVFNNAASVETISLLQRLFNNKCAVEVPTSERNGEQNRFANGQALFVFSTSSGLPFYQQAVSQGLNFKFDIALLPHTQTPAVNLYGASISIFKTTPEKELAAWLVIKFLGEKAQTARWALNTGYLPVRRSAEQDVIDGFKADPKWGPAADSYARMFDWVQYATTEPTVAGYSGVRDLIDQAVMSRVITDATVDPKTLLDAAVSQANQLLRDNAPAN